MKRALIAVALATVATLALGAWTEWTVATNKAHYCGSAVSLSSK